MRNNNIPIEILNRKGAQKAVDIPEQVLLLLNSGLIESVNLTEWLAVDHLELVKQLFVDTKDIEKQIKALKKPSTMQIIRVIGEYLYTHHQKDTQLYKRVAEHISDSIRCYAPFWIAKETDLSIEEKLDKCRPFIGDHHFGVREVVWMALRPEMSLHLERVIPLLTEWATSPEANIRRFCTESLRPRGVWCAHIEALKEQPEKLLPVLECLKSDPSKYVQDSVGNWLNDASKTRPDFVRNLCSRWSAESPTKATAYIVKKAMRSIE